MKSKKHFSKSLGKKLSEYYNVSKAVSNIPLRINNSNIIVPNALSLTLPCLLLGGTGSNLSGATFSRNVGVTIKSSTLGTAVTDFFRFDIDGTVGANTMTTHPTNDFDFDFLFRAVSMNMDGIALNGTSVSLDPNFNAYVAKLGYNAAIGGNFGQVTLQQRAMTFSNLQGGTANSLWRADGLGFIGLNFSIGGTTYTGWVAAIVNDQHDPGDRQMQIIAAKWSDTGGANTTPAVGSLAVEIAEMKARAWNRSVKLSWITKSEVNNAGFEIERSENGIDFRSVAWVDGHGTTYEQQEYFYDDKDLREGQTYHYRLKQIDFDGKFEFSDIVTATIQSKKVSVGEFFPNPSLNGAVSLEFNSQSESDWSITVYDVSGKEQLLLNRIIPADSEKQNFDFSIVGKGTFFVKFENRTEKIYRKLIIE